MKERPILFSGPMVRAILEGRKTQTRRVARVDGLDAIGPGGNRLIGDVRLACRDASGNHVVLKPQHGNLGDQLWVRETWRIDGLSTSGALEIGRRHTDGLSFRCDMDGDRSCDDCAWISSIHMPRWASRIDLEITAVRVERLQDISEEDAKKEGVIPDEYEGREHPDNPVLSSAAHYSSFRDLWQSIYGPDSWTANPWVWVYEFRRVNP